MNLRDYQTEAIKAIEAQPPGAYLEQMATGLGNHVDNLEWISPSKNKSFGTRNVRISDSKKKTIEKLDPKSGNVVGSFLGAVAAAKSCGLHSASSIRKCCRGAVRFCDGYEWRYAENG